MIAISTQKNLRKVRDLPFCYICGKQFTREDSINHDHVPPRAIFAIEDKNFPLKLTTHVKCNSRQKEDDEVIGQLISLLHGKTPSKKNDKLKIKIYSINNLNQPLAGFNVRNIEFLIRRWIKGFHAALYQKPLSDSSKFAIQSPFPKGIIKNGKIVPEKIKQQHIEVVDSIKKNRLAKSLDVIITNNGKLRYECLWDRLSDHSWVCIFALDLYGWKRLGDINNFSSRGCAGLYRPLDGHLPVNATKETNLEFLYSNTDITDPFAE